jgi:hypothetical protein
MQLLNLHDFIEKLVQINWCTTYTQVHYTKQTAWLHTPAKIILRQS